MKIYISKRVTFESAHFLPLHKGKCKNLHGHRWELVVQVYSDSTELIDGMVMDYTELKEILQTSVINIFDHKCLNDILPREMNPTSENIAHFIYNVLTDLLYQVTKGRVKLSKVILKETENSECLIGGE